uniref:Membrane-anchored junction protein n=1 Tax=Esox lucius TaxID=8010 RepID=A0AAY5KE99_ESOLU
MPIRYFSFPLPETRFFQAEQHVYKFKIRVGSNCSEVDMIGEQFVNEELENAIRAVLANLNCLQPFTTTHFTIYPYKSKWMRVSELRFEKLSGEKLLAYPYLITLYLETNTQTAKCVEATQTATEWVISASLNPQSAVGSSVTDGSEAKGVTRNHEDKELHYGTVEESDLEEPNLSPDLDPKPSVRSGVLARFVSQVFPFSMFYNKN